MSSADPRGRRVAVVADSLLVELLPKLEAGGWGTIQLPPSGLAAETTAEWLEQVAEHVAEFVRNDYEVVLAGGATDEAELNEKLAELGVPPLDPAPF